MSQIKKPLPSVSVLPLPPLEYDVQFMNLMVRVLNYYIQQQGNPGPIRGNFLTLATIDPLTQAQLVAIPDSDIDPTTSLPYPPGTVWYDPAADNVLKIVP